MEVFVARCLVQHREYAPPVRAQQQVVVRVGVTNNLIEIGSRIEPPIESNGQVLARSIEAIHPDPQGCPGGWQ